MMIPDDDEQSGSGQPAPHETQQGADTPDQSESSAVGNVEEPHCAPADHRSADLSSSDLRTLEISRQLFEAHRKIGAARKLLEEFWRRSNAHEPYSRDNAWAMHVVLVQLASLLERPKAQKKT